MNGSREVICQWLKIPRDPWPPDHYTLLGLPPGEANVELIEHRVQERMQAVRCYQLTHSEPATEAMNRLAQAFACLSDLRAKRAYDRDKLGLKVEPEPVIPPVVPPRPVTPTPAAPPPIPTAQDWVDQQLKKGFPVAASAAGRTELVTDESPESADVVMWNKEAAPPPSAAPGENPSPPLPTTEPIDPLLRAAQSSAPARRGLGTKKALYYRITRTRALLRVWDVAGKYLAHPERRPTRTSEARELMDALRRVVRLLPEFPAILGEAGQPGYLVVSLARQTAIVPTFQSLLPSQREALARDWNNGQRLLIAHKQFLRTEAKALRRKPLLLLAVRAGIAYLDENPVSLLALVGLVALIIALCRTLL